MKTNQKISRYWWYRSSHPEVFLVKGVLQICIKFTGEYPCWSVISVKLLCNFIEITLRHGCFPVNFLYISRTLFSKNTSGWLLLVINKITYRTTKTTLLEKWWFFTNLLIYDFKNIKRYNWNKTYLVIIVINIIYKFCIQILIKSIN